MNCGKVNFTCRMIPKRLQFVGHKPAHCFCKCFVNHRHFFDKWRLESHLHCTGPGKWEVVACEKHKARENSLRSCDDVLSETSCVTFIGFRATLWMFLSLLWHLSPRGALWSLSMRDDVDGRAALYSLKQSRTAGDLCQTDCDWSRVNWLAIGRSPRDQSCQIHEMGKSGLTAVDGV